MDVEDALSGKIDLRKLVASADFQEENVMIAAMEQPKLYLQAVTLKVNASRKTTMLEAQFDLLKSKLSKEIRSKRTVKTEGHLKEILLRRKRYRRAKWKWDQAKDQEAYYEKLCRMFEMRRDMIKVVSHLMGAEHAIAERRLAEKVDRDQRQHLRDKAAHKYGRHH